MVAKCPKCGADKVPKVGESVHSVFYKCSCGYSWEVYDRRANYGAVKV